MTKQEFILMHISNYCVATRQKEIESFTRAKEMHAFIIEDAIAHAELIWEKLPVEYKP